MKLQVLVDNNTLIDQYYLGEPAVSYYIEDEDEKILFDAGYSDILIKNANKMKIQLKDLSTIVFSHGHNDHTRGFRFLQEKYNLSETTVIAHPDAFHKKYYEGEEIGSPYTAKKMAAKCNLNLSRNPLLISKNIMFLGEIPNSNSFEIRRGIGEQEQNGIREKDMLLDDTAVVHQSEQGLFIISGCSHSGICNIIEHAKKVCGDNRIIGILGGFHLFHVNDQLQNTIDYFKQSDIRTLYPCHCVSFDVKAELHKSIKINEVGVGMCIEI